MSTPSPAQMPEQEKKLAVQKLLLESYQTDDPAVRIPLLREILNLDPMNSFAREDLSKAEIELEKRLVERRNAQEKEHILRLAADALASDDAAKLNDASAQLTEVLKTFPDDKEMADMRQGIQAGLDRRRVRRQVEEAIRNGRDAYFRDDSLKLILALPLIDDALKADSANPELQAWRERIEARLLSERTRHLVTSVLVGAVIVGIVGIALFFILRKPKGILELLDGKHAGERYALVRQTTRIGSITDGNDLVLDGEKGMISRHHCEIIRLGGRYFLKDTSSNGSWVNGEYLDNGQSMPLRSGDRLSLAGELTLVFHVR